MHGLDGRMQDAAEEMAAMDALKTKYSHVTEPDLSLEDQVDLEMYLFKVPLKEMMVAQVLQVHPMVQPEAVVVWVQLVLQLVDQVPMADQA